MANLASTFTQLQAAYRSSSSDTSKLGPLLKQAKLALLHAGFLSPPSTGKVNPQNFSQAREILELSALLSIRTRDTAAFERYYAQLGSFWELESASSPSKYRPALVGLYLLLLLSRNEIGKFHTVLESLSASADSKLMEDRHVQYPIELERWLMEGSYSKVWQARSKPPVPEFTVFLDDLMTTIRNEIASCGEKAYTSLPIADAGTLLFFKERKDLLAFASQRPGWMVNPSSSTIFFGPQGTAQVEDEQTQRQKVIQATLEYAKELETIV